MKKNLALLALVLAGGVVAANAYPGVDMTVGGAPFQVIQQQSFQKMEMDDYKKFKDAKDKPAEKSLETPVQMKEDFQRKYDYENRQSRFKLFRRNANDENGEQIHLDTSNMEFVRDKDGKTTIKYGD